MKGYGLRYFVTGEALLNVRIATGAWSFGHRRRLLDARHPFRQSG